MLHTAHSTVFKNRIVGWKDGWTVVGSGRCSCACWLDQLVSGVLLQPVVVLWERRRLAGTPRANRSLSVRQHIVMADFFFFEDFGRLRQ